MSRRAEIIFFLRESDGYFFLNSVGYVDIISLSFTGGRGLDPIPTPPRSGHHHSIPLIYTDFHIKLPHCLEMSACIKWIRWYTRQSVGPGTLQRSLYLLSFTKNRHRIDFIKQQLSCQGIGLLSPFLILWTIEGSLQLLHVYVVYRLIYPHSLSNTGIYLYMYLGRKIMFISNLCFIPSCICILYTKDLDVLKVKTNTRIKSKLLQWFTRMSFNWIGNCVPRNGRLYNGKINSKYVFAHVSRWFYSVRFKKIKDE